MRVVCPSCQAAYEVPAAVLDAGRTLRCAECSADFTPASPRPPLPIAGPPLVPTVAMRPRARRSVIAAWMVSGVLLVAMGWAFLALRAPISRAWPASGRIYAALGFK